MLCSKIWTKHDDLSNENILNNLQSVFCFESLNCFGCFLRPDRQSIRVNKIAQQTAFPRHILQGINGNGVSATRHTTMNSPKMEINSVRRVCRCIC